MGDGAIYSSKLMQTRGGKIKINPLILENSFYKDINKNKIFFKLRGKSNQTYLYNINYGVVKAGISETRAYEAIKDKIIELPDIEIKQEELAVLGQNDKIEIIIPNNIAAEWDNSNLNEGLNYSIKISSPKILELILDDTLDLNESIILDKLGIKLLTDSSFDLKLGMKITSDRNNYFVDKDILMPKVPIKVGRLDLRYISPSEVFTEGIENDPEPFIKEIILVDDVNILDKQDIIELELFSGAIEFDPKKGES